MPGYNGKKLASPQRRKPKSSRNRYKPDFFVESERQAPSQKAAGDVDVYRSKPLYSRGQGSGANAM
jgi:hypothetical protein